MAAAIPEDVRRFLEKPDVAVPAARAPTGRVRAAPVWFMYTDGHIVIDTARGRRTLRNPESHPEVALVVLDREDPRRYVQIRGRVAATGRRTASASASRRSG